MKYSTLYLDLDNTVLDFSASERNAIKELFSMHGLPSDDETVKLYSEINQSWWERFERGEIQKNAIFSGRFETLLELLSLSGDTQKLSEDYFGLLSNGHDTIPGAKELISDFKKAGYYICVTTNGVSRTQYKRIAQSGLAEFFDKIFVSEDANHQKPEKEYFEYVYAHSPEKDKSKILVIGDSLSSDIKGGMNFGVDTCWYNPKNSAGVITPTYTVTDFDGIRKILL